MTDQKYLDHRSTTTSTGTDLSEGSYLDAHYEAMRTEYEIMIRSVGINQAGKCLMQGAGVGVSFLCWPNW